MIQPRIYRVMYRSGHNGKLVKGFDEYVLHLEEVLT